MIYLRGELIVSAVYLHVEYNDNDNDIVIVTVMS